MSDDRLRRFAVVTSAMGVDERTVARYLPGNYTVLASGPDMVLISGYDTAGWTMEDYLIPRFASGLYQCREVDTDRAVAIMMGAPE